MMQLTSIVRISFLVAVIAFGATSAWADPFRGNVLDGATLAPVDGATVSAPDGTRTTTNRAGEFALQLTPGTNMVTVSAAGYETNTEEVKLPPGGIPDHVFLILKPGAAFESIEVEDAAPVPPTVGRQDLAREVITRIPGTRGDALTAVRSLPGVGNTVGGGNGSGPGLIVIRGAAPEDSKITIDGIEVPVLYHFFGLQSVLPSEFIQNIEFSPGGFGAEEGRATGGVINVVTRDEAAPDTTGFVELSFINIAGFLQTPLSRRHNITLTAAARRSLIDFILPAVVPDTVNFTTAPQYYDGQLRLDWRRRDGEKLSLLAFTSFDLLSLINGNLDPNEPDFTGFDNETSFGRVIAQWSKSAGAWTNRMVASAGTGAFRVEVADRFIRADQYTVELRDDLSWQASPRLRLRGGTETRWNPRDVRVRFPAPPQEGQPPPANFSNATLVEYTKKFNTDVIGAYLAGDVKATKSTTVTVGGRLDYYDHIGDTTLAPRIQLTQEAAEDVTIRAAVGRYSRGFDQAESSATQVDPEIATQYVVGAEVRLSDAITGSASAFYTERRELLVQDPLLAQTSPAEPYVNRGTGRSFGAEYLLKAKGERFFGWLSYTFSRSDRIDGPMMDRRLFDFDQTHNFLAVASWRLGAWEFGGKWQYSTGQPQTPIIGSVYLSDFNSFIPQYGPINSTRMEAAHQLDLRIDRRWKFRSWDLSAYIDITNVYAHARVLGYEYNYDFTREAPVEDLPLVPALGVRGSF